MKNEKHLVCVSANNGYLIPVSRVKEIVKIKDIYSIPDSPDGVLGTFKLRGRHLFLIDSRVRFGLTGATDVSKSVVIIQIENTPNPISIGVLFDQVNEVVVLDENNKIEPFDLDCSIGSTKIKSVVSTLINVDLLLGQKSIKLLGAVTGF